jgi:hypothetical protein
MRTPCLAVRNAAVDQASHHLPGGSAVTKRVLFSDLQISPPSARAPPGDGPTLLLSHPAGGFLHALDRQKPHRLHRRGISSDSGLRPRGWTSDLFSSKPTSELGGRALWRRTSDRCRLAIHSDPYPVTKQHCTVPVYKPLFILNKPVLSQPLSLLHVHKLVKFDSRHRELFLRRSLLGEHRTVENC